MSRLAAFTIITYHHLRHARVLHNSFMKSHPEAVFFVLIIDISRKDCQLLGEPFHLLSLEDLDSTWIYEMKIRYSKAELCTALKPILAKKLLLQDKFDIGIYLDSDIQIFSRFDEIENLLRRHAVLFTPHILYNSNQWSPENELSILVHGTNNAGFVALNNSSYTIEFLDWWSVRTSRWAYFDYQNGMSGDQKWLDLASQIFHFVGKVIHPGYNISYWNAHERALKIEGSRYLVDDHPLRFFHYSQFNLDRPGILRKGCPNQQFTDTKMIREIVGEYKNELGSIEPGSLVDIQPEDLDDIGRWIFRSALSRSNNGISVEKAESFLNSIESIVSSS